MSQRQVGLATALGALALFFTAPAAHAQAPGAVRPPFSPYLNLTRPGNTAINYYGLVRPEVDFRNSLNGLQSQYNALNQDANDPRNAQSFPGTGHGAAFLNYSHYYALRGSSARSPIGVGSGIVGGTGATAPAGSAYSAPPLQGTGGSNTANLQRPAAGGRDIRR
ncbi:MAG: hypothetical protein U0746_07940 [Gemmataceae bacterium]